MSNGETVIWWIHTALTTWWLFLCFTQGRERRARFLLMLYTSVVYVALAVWCRFFPRFSPYHLLWLDPTVFFVTGSLTVKRLFYKDFRLRYAPPALPTLLIGVGIVVVLLTKFSSWLILGGAAILAVGWAVYGGSKRNKKLVAWTKTVTLSKNVRRAMHELQLAAKAASRGERVSDCPLQFLTSEERGYLHRVCDPAFRPEEFAAGDSFESWSHLREELKTKGLTHEQAQLVVGMEYNGFTSINLTEENESKPTAESSGLAIGESDR